MTQKSIQLDPKDREWEYDGDGNRIYKMSADYRTKTLWYESEMKDPEKNTRDIDQN